MSLRRKIALVLSLSVAILFGLDNFLHGKTFAIRFEREQDALAKRAIGRIVEGVESEVNELYATVQRVATALEFRDLQDSDGLDLLLHGAGLDVLMVYDAEGRMLYHQVLDPLTGDALKLMELPNEQFSKFHPLRRSLNSPGAGGFERIEKGLITTARGPVLIATRSVLTPGGFDATVGIGRFLSGEWLRGLQGDGPAIELHLLKGFSPTAKVQTLVDRIMDSPTEQVVEYSGDELQAWGILFDLAGNPACLIGQAQPNHLGPLWADLREYSFLSLGALIVLCPLVLLLLLQIMVTGPLRKLTEHSISVGRDSTTDKRLHMDRKDEIGQLAEEFDSMLDQLAASRSVVIQSARMAGASDISTGVLHNVGNSLNSVGISARMLNEKLGALPLDDLASISQALLAKGEDLQAYLTQDARGKFLPDFLQALNGQMHADAAQLREEMTELLGGVTGIESLLTSLESFGAGSGLKEPVDMAAQLDSVIEFSQALAEGEGTFEIVKAYGPMGRVFVDRHKFNEVLLNLLRNSMGELGMGGLNRIVVDMLQDFDGGLSVTVTDSGAGLDDEDLIRVFAMNSSAAGTSTVNGLHLAATIATEMGADLSAHSPGLGQGSTFQLHLPASNLAA